MYTAGNLAANIRLIGAVFGSYDMITDVVRDERRPRDLVTASSQ